MGTSLYLYSSPLPAVNAASRAGDLGKITLLPFICMALNSFLWATYGFAIYNMRVLGTAIFGMGCSLYYMAVFYALSEDKDLLWNYIQIALLFITGTVWYTYYLVSTIHAPYNLGLIASFINILMYGSPAAELPQICRTGNTESMPLGLSLATFLCSVFWWLYGIEIDDPFLIWPNLIGAAFGGVQLGTIYRFLGSQAMTSNKSVELSDDLHELLGHGGDEPKADHNGDNRLLEDLNNVSIELNQIVQETTSGSGEASTCVAEPGAGKEEAAGKEVPSSPPPS